MNFKDFIKENERDFSDYVGLKKQVSNLEAEISKIKANIMTNGQTDEDLIEENEKDIKRIDQEIAEIEKQIIEIKLSLKKGGVLYRIFNKDKYNAESDKLSSLYAKRDKLVEEKNRITKIFIEREKLAKSKQQIPEMESQIDSLKDKIEEKKKKLIELITEQSRDNFNSAVHKESEKQKTISSLTSDINKLTLKIRQIKESVQVRNTKSQELTQIQLDKKICEKEECEKRFDEEITFFNLQKKLFDNLKINIDDDQIIKKLLHEVVDKTRENQDRQVTIFGRNCSASQGIELIEMQHKNNEDINVEKDKENDIEGGETVLHDTRLNKEEKDFYNSYIEAKMKEEGTIIRDRESLKFNERGRLNNKRHDDREAI